VHRSEWHSDETTKPPRRKEEASQIYSMVKSAIVIGGGIAGLTAASELLRRGCQVTVVEAASRLGGRIHTVQHDRFPVELGAEFIHGENPSLRSVIKAANLSSHEVPEQNQVFAQGTLRPVDLWERMNKIVGTVDRHKPDQSWLEFLNHSPLSALDRQWAIRFVEGFHAADPARISAHGLVRADDSSSRSDGEKNSRLDAGYTALVDWLAQDVARRGGIFRMNHTARLLRWKLGEVEVLVENQATERLAAQVAVITLPLGVLQAETVKFEPSLTHKREAIESMSFGQVVKLNLVFRHPWWPETDFGFIHSYDDPMPTWWSHGRCPMLTGWAGGPKADALLHVSPEELITIGLNCLGKVFSRTAKSLRAELVASYTCNWGQDRNVRGAYSYVPVNGLDLPKLLAAPVDDTLFFAGEATALDGQLGTVFGAVESGLRAATEIAGIC
jgi:monoamine oxidase